MISAILITLNEEKKLATCLGTITNLADEIIVVDSGSTDETLVIAKNFGAKVFRRPFDNFANQRNFAVDKATGEWIFSLDADEEIPRELSEEIKKAVANPSFDAYLIPRRNIIFGGEIKHTRWSPDEHIWLFRRDQGKFIGAVHEEVKTTGRVGRLVNAKIHHSHQTLADFMKMMRKYTSLEAKEKFAKGTRFSISHFFWDPILSFGRRYIYKKGFLDGWRGLVLSLLMALYRATTWLKILALQIKTK